MKRIFYIPRPAEYNDIKLIIDDKSDPRNVQMFANCHWAALEGCHRLRAAAKGLTPEIIEVDYSDEMRW